jgi:hypothetical protein
MVKEELNGKLVTRKHTSKKLTKEIDLKKKFIKK